jgi:glucan-binding YG repeat protein
VKPANTPDSETGLNKAVTVNLETFEGFKYTLEIGGEAPEQSRFLRFKVSADLPAKRTVEPNESSDDKKKKDDAFNKQQETLKTRLAAEQKLQNWIFEVESYSLETFLKPRKDILTEASPAQKPALNTGGVPKPAVPLPLAATPTPAVSPGPAIPSPSPESSATPEATPTPETTATPEMNASPETTPTPETKPTPETTPTPETKTTSETTPSPEATPTPEAVPSNSPSPSATPGT